eukprot:1345076-Amorphochlora_amoeboformis.AAC.2
MSRKSERDGYLDEVSSDKEFRLWWVVWRRQFQWSAAVWVRMGGMPRRRATIVQGTDSWTRRQQKQSTEEKTNGDERIFREKKGAINEYCGGRYMTLSRSGSWSQTRHDTVVMQWSIHDTQLMKESHK